MPIIQSAIKAMRQSRVKAARNQHYKNRMKSMIKLVMGYVKAKDVEKATKALPEVLSTIDTAAKKNIIHWGNAARRKSRVQSTVQALVAKK